MFYSHLPDPVALQGNPLQLRWSQGLLALQSLALHKVIRGEMQVFSYPSMLASKRMFSPCSTAPCRPASLAARCGASPQSAQTPANHLKTLGRSLCRQGNSREASVTMCAAHRASMCNLCLTNFGPFLTGVLEGTRIPIHPNIRTVLSYLQHL